MLALGDIDPVALHNYMSFHAVVPAPYTMLKGVRKLAPATYMEISPNGQCTETCYWQLNFETSTEEQKYTSNDWQDRVLYSFYSKVNILANFRKF